MPDDNAFDMSSESDILDDGLPLDISAEGEKEEEDDPLKDAPLYVRDLKKDADIYSIQDMLLKGDKNDPDFKVCNTRVSAVFSDIESSLMSLLARALRAHLATVAKGVSPLNTFDPASLEKELNAIAELIKYLEGESTRFAEQKADFPVMTALFLKHVIRLLRAYQHLIYEELDSRDEIT